MFWAISNRYKYPPRHYRQKLTIKFMLNLWQLHARRYGEMNDCIHILRASGVRTHSVEFHFSINSISFMTFFRLFQRLVCRYRSASQWWDTCYWKVRATLLGGHPAYLKTNNGRHLHNPKGGGSRYQHLSNLDFKKFILDLIEKRRFRINKIADIRHWLFY